VVGFRDLVLASFPNTPSFGISRDCSIGGRSEHKEGRASYRAEEGWRPYVGTNPHTDHIHFSFSWAGARKQTSYRDGTPVTYG
jgi:hypothetical protein